MHEHWAEFGPPVHVAVAAYLGLTKPKERRRIEDPEDPGNLGELIDMFSGAGGQI
jgi:hypothetical protein